MGDECVGVFVLADTAASVERFVSVFIGVYVLLILAYIVVSWIPPGASGTLEPVRRFLRDVCEPYLGLFRRFIPPFGMLDLSPIAAVFSLYILERLVTALIDQLL